MAIFQQALAAVQGEHCTREQLQRSGLPGPVAVIAIGKAAASMTHGALQVLGEQVSQALVLTKAGHCADFSAYAAEVSCLESGHPWPDERSLRAGQALLTFIDAQPRSHSLLFLISGGSSSLVEVLPEGVGLNELRAINDWLLASGWDIHAMNRVRKALSTIKGGRLAEKLAGRRTLCLLISDVPSDALHVIGSGLLTPDPDNSAELPELPHWMEKALGHAPPAPAADAACFANISTQLIASVDDAKQAAATSAAALGYAVRIHETPLSGDAATMGEALVKVLQDSAPGLHIWGGETTVCLPPQPGQGGRNQQLALAAARAMAGQDDLFLLAAGTDGSDGPTTAAGALVDGASIARGEAQGLDSQLALEMADAGRFLGASQDLIHTGPTGTNVMDLVLGLRV
jgi:hydroxypyruvate reductase